MRRIFWVLAAMAMAAVVGALILNLPEAEDGKPQLAANGTIAYGASGNIRAVNPDGTDDARVIGTRNDGVNQDCPSYSPDGLLHAHFAVNDELDLIIHAVGETGRPSIIAHTSRLDRVEAAVPQCGHWSPSGRYITVGALDQIGNPNGWHVVPTSGAAPPIPLAGQRPVWGPDDQLAWIAEGNIVIADSTGQETTTIDTQSPPMSIAWSPDGSRLAYVAVPPGEIRTQLYVIGSDGTNDTRVTESHQDRLPRGGPSTLVGSPAWSLDSAAIAYVAETCPVGPRCEARVGVALDGLILMLPEPIVEGLPLGGVTGPLVWAPDGTSLLGLYQINAGTYSRSAIINMPIEGGTPTLVAEESYVYSYDWQRR